MLGLVAAGLLGTGLYDWLHVGIGDHTGRAVFFGLMLIALFWAALVYIFKLSMCVLVGPRGISLVRGPWRTELFWRDTARLVERTEPDGGQRFRWVVVMARDGRELRVREDMVLNYMRFRAEVYERYLLWRDHGGTWGTSGSGPFKATDVVANTVAWWLFGAGMFLLPGLYFWLLLPETGFTGPTLFGLAALCALEGLLTFLGRQTYTVSTKEITRKRPFRPATHLLWRNVSRIDRARHPAGGLIRVGIAIGRLLMAIAARTDSRFKSFAWSPRVPEYLTLRGEGRHVEIRLHRLIRADEMLAWVEYYERIGRRGETPSRPVAPSPPAATGRPATRSTARPAATGRPAIRSTSQPAGMAPGQSAATSGPVDPWANGLGGDLPADAFPTELQPAVGATRPPDRPTPENLPRDVPPSVAAAFSASEDERPEGDSWLWDTSKMPRVSANSSSSNIFARPPEKAPRTEPADSPPMPTFTPPPTAGPAFNPRPGGNTPAETPWWMVADAPAADPTPSWDEGASWEAQDVYPPVSYPGHADHANSSRQPHQPRAPEYPPAYPPPTDDQQSPYAAFAQQPDYPQRPASPPFVQRTQEYPPPEPPEEQGPSEREMFDENLAQSQQWRDQQNWQRPQLPRFGPQPEGEDESRPR